MFNDVYRLDSMIIIFCVAGAFIVAVVVLLLMLWEVRE